MSIFIEPWIDPMDYDAFRRILDPDLPDTQDEWLQLLLEQRLPRLQAGDEVKQITVEPDEFVRYCQATGAGRNLQSLRALATVKHAGRRD